MQINCPHCAKINRLNAEKIGAGPICGVCGKYLLTSPLDLNAINIGEVLSQHALPVMIDFWAPWCGPCKMFAPTFKASAEKFANQIVYAKVNTEAEQMLGAKYNIRSIPTLAYFWQGKELGRISGALGLDQLNALALQIIHGVKVK